MTIGFEFSAVVWLAFAVVAAIVEVLIPHFGLAFASAGAVAAALTSFLGFSLGVQFVVFVLVLAVSLALLRPRLVARFSARGVPSRTDRFIGREGVVTHEIDRTTGAGRVNVGGDDWAARGTEVLPVGTKIRVVGADGIVLEVTRS